VKRMIYLSYPIDNAMLKDSTVKEINRSKEFLLGHDLNPAAVVFDPGDAFMVRKGSNPGPEIASINMNVIDQAEGVLAWLPQGVSSIGVPMEIAHAAMQGVPVAVISDTYSWALQLPRDNIVVFPEGRADAAMEWLLSVEYDPMSVETSPLPVASVRGFSDKGLLPTRAHDDDAGLDLYVSEDTTLPWGQFVDVPCGVKVELPDWSWGLLVGRSSTFRRRQIEVQTGIIDAGYRGELFAACIWRPENLSMDDHVDPPVLMVKAGERLAQLIIIPNGTKDVTPVPVSMLSTHDRGENGFGSSGA
jgi:dUTP pyrophosphatase